MMMNHSSESIAECFDLALRGQFGSPPDEHFVSVAFIVNQLTKHMGRESVYRNRFICIRSGVHVGICYVEENQIEQSELEECVGQPLSRLMEHELLPMRVAALDAYLGDIFPHKCSSAIPVLIPEGSSDLKSSMRARSVIDMMDLQPSEKVALIGVVNSLVKAIRDKKAVCLPCDFSRVSTEDGEPITRNMWDVVSHADKVLATGMTLSNGTFEPLLDYVNRHNKPLTVFAQTGNAVFPHLMGMSFTNLCAEPFPFFSLHGCENCCYQYRFPFKAIWK
jgi:hypothetical protein